MPFRNGKAYTVKFVSKNDRTFSDVQAAMDRKTKNGYNRTILKDLWDVRWIKKPFSWSYSREFKPNCRFFWHGTSKQNIYDILDNGFKVGGSNTSKSNGSMLGRGVYATFHTHKVAQYAVDGFVVSVMIYAPRTLLVTNGQTLTQKDHQAAYNQYHAIEVTSGANVHNRIGGKAMINHEICVFDPIRVIPRYICRIK